MAPGCLAVGGSTAANVNYRRRPVPSTHAPRLFSRAVGHRPRFESISDRWWPVVAGNDAARGLPRANAAAEGASERDDAGAGASSPLDDEPTAAVMRADEDPRCKALIVRKWSGSHGAIEVADDLTGSTAAYAVALAVTSITSDYRSKRKVKRLFMQPYVGPDGQPMTFTTVVMADESAYAAALECIPNAAMESMRMSFLAGNADTGVDLHSVQLRRCQRFRLTISPEALEYDARYPDAEVMPDVEGARYQAEDRGISLLDVSGDMDLLMEALWMLHQYVDRCSPAGGGAPLAPGEWVPSPTSPLRFSLAEDAGGAAGAAGAGGGARYRVAYRAGGEGGAEAEVEVGAAAMEGAVDLVDALLEDRYTMPELMLPTVPPVVPAPRNWGRLLRNGAGAVLAGVLFGYKLTMPHLPTPPPPPGSSATAPRWSERITTSFKDRVLRLEDKPEIYPINDRLPSAEMDRLCRMVKVMAGGRSEEAGGAAAAAEGDAGSRAGGEGVVASFQVVVDRDGNVLGNSPANEHAIKLWENSPLRKQVMGAAESLAQGKEPHAQRKPGYVPEAVVLRVVVDRVGRVLVFPWAMDQ